MLNGERDALELLEEQLCEAVKIQSNADVPLGAFLSGGVDSSTIVALMQEQSRRSVKTFTVAFEQAAFDEAPHARAIANHLGTEHTEFVVTSADALAVVPLLPTMYDEPFADSSQIPTHLVCRSAREKVTVALSGDAGDELFGGYNRYFWGPRIWAKAHLVPKWIREILCIAAERIPTHAWDALESMWRPHRSGNSILRFGEKAQKLATCMSGSSSIDDLYGNLVSEWRSPTKLLKKGTGTGTPPSLLLDPLPTIALSNDTLRMMYWDSITYLPDDILCKVDRAAMASSLETRIPFLDHRVAELAWRLPMHMKIRNGQGKWALRQILYRRVPRDLIERPKAGFAIPISHWLRGPLKGWAEALLDGSRLRRDGFFEPEPIRQAWKQHLAGRDNTGKIWTVLMFQSWLETHR
jgi:asparagine synthase (glutamine-hydrolysing)